jgi:predicted RNA-binding Zn ribbon-like protein
MEKATISLTSIGSATHAAKRAADIVFILQNKEQVDDATLAGQLNETLQAYGEKDPKVTDRDLSDLRSVADMLYKVFSTQVMGDAARSLNGILARYASAPRLSAHNGTPWHLHVDSDDHAPWAQWLATSSALGLATLLAEKQRNPGGLCASCNRPFVDSGKGGGRSYCSPRCATRERVAAYRKRVR